VRLANYVGGCWRAVDDVATLDDVDPASGEVTALVPLSGERHVREAVAAARAAQPEWRAVPPQRRARAVLALRSQLLRRREELTALVSADMGKTLADADGEVGRGIESVESAAAIPHLLKGETLEGVAAGVDVEMVRQPVGVVAAITPFNFPAMIPLWFLPYAIACGNAFILKPSEQDPRPAALIVEMVDAVEEIPAGVVNLVHGGREAVTAILDDPGIDAISFVGQAKTALFVAERATARGKRVQALGGAKNHMIVLPDADIEMAADAAVSAAYGSAGERCMAISQVVAVGHAADPLVAAIKERLPKIKVGSGLDEGVEMGPLVTREHRDKVAGYIDGAREQGATVVADGRETAPEGDGFFLGVSLLDDVTPEMDAYRDEIFGPVLGVTRVATYDEAVKLINENPYGNGTAIFTRDGGVARQFQFEVEAGMVGINVPIPVPVAYYSFGGWKSSLFGDTHIYGPEGINFYTRGKVVTSRWPDPATSQVDLGFPQTR